MRASGIAPQRDPARIEPEILGTAARELHRGADVMHHPRIGLLAGLGQPVADRKAGIAARSEIRPPILERVARAAPPVAAMDINDDRERPGRRRQIEIALELDAIVGGIGQVVMELARWLRHGISPKIQAPNRLSAAPWISIGAADFP